MNGESPGDRQLEALRIEMRALTRTVDLLVARADAIARDVESNVASDVRDHEQRLRKLEAWKYAIPVSLLLMLASFLGTLVR